MRFKATTWILIGALAAVAAYFFLVEEKSRSRDERRRRESRKLFLYESKDLERFVLVNPQGERIEAERIGDDWKIVSPVIAPGDGPTISAFIGQVVPGRRGQELAGAANLADYGLEHPFATLILHRAGSPVPDTLFVGDKTPTSSNSYVRINSTGPVLISSEITHNVMNKNLFHLRDKNFIEIDTESIDGLTVRSGARTLRLRREGAYWWLEGRRVRADRIAVERYLASLAQAIIYEFVREDTEDLAPYGLASPAARLTVASGSRTIHISFGEKKGDRVNVVREGLDKVVLLEDKMLEAFDWTDESLRARNLSFFAEDSVTVVRYEAADTSVVLRRTGTKWSTTGADTTAIRSWEVNALLRRLTSTVFNRIASEPLVAGDARLAEPLLRVTLENATGGVIDVVTLAGPEDGVQHGASKSADCIGELPARTFDGIHSLFRRIGGGG